MPKNCQSRHRPWTEGEVAALRLLYDRGSAVPLGLAAFAASIGREKANVCRKARALGLATDHHRRMVLVRADAPKYATDEERRAALSAYRKRHIAERGHPRGFAGHTHTAEARAIMAQSAAKRRPLTEQERQGMSDRMAELQRTDPRMRQGYSRAAGGKRDDLGGVYFRSIWEANVARYLNFLMAQGQVHRWEYEADTFWFHKIKRGTRSYTPDFKIWDTADGEPYYWEVKGWMDGPSKTRLARMARYYPKVRVEVIDKAAYNGIKQYRGLIPGWETGAAPTF